MAPPGCPFCTRLQARETPLIDEPLVVAFVEEHPHAIGHAVVIPRLHVGRLIELSDDEHQSLFATARELLRELEARHHPDAFTVGMNDGPAAGQSVPHVHLHLIPRHSGDVPDPRGGIRKTLPPPLAD
jgi:diadenosine tetraphosphate (Ap4A) HIT family hydrolase